MSAAFSESALSTVLLEAVARAGIGVVVTDREGEVLRVVYASRVGAELLRTSVEALLSGDARFLIAERHRPELIRISTAVRQGLPEAMPFEMAVLRADGTELPCELSVTPIELGGRTFMVSFFWSVESRKKAEARAHALDVLFKGVIESATDGVVVSRQGRVLWSNDAAAKILGLGAPADLVGQSLGAFLFPEDLAEMTRRVRAMLEKGERFGAHAYRARRADGREVVAEVTSMPIAWEGAPAVLAFVRDVTERSRMTERLAQTDRLTALGTLAAGVAHEINNPMSAVIFGLEAAQRLLRRPALDEKTRGDLNGLLAELGRGADRVVSIVKDLRVFARGGDNSVVPLELGLVVEAAERIAGHVVRSRASLHVDLEALPRVKGNAARLEQVVVNLLVNAAQAMPEGRDVMLNRVQVTGRAEADHVVLEVSDNGQGISPEALPHMFEPFFSTKPIGVGMGLGLSICHSIVRQLGGDLTVASTGESGTTLAVRLLRA